MRALPASTPMLLALVLLAPAAAACSFAGEPPRPATFTLVPHDGGNKIVLEVDGRMAGGGCELSNPIAYDDGVFAWMEYQWNPDRRIAVLVDLSTSERRTVTLRADQVEGFGYWNGKLLYRGMQYHESAPDAQRHRTITTESTFYVHDVEADEVRTLPLPAEGWIQVFFDGPRVIAMQRESEPVGPQLLTVYDIDQDEVVVDARRVDGLRSNTGYLAITAAGDGWLAMEGDTPFLYEIATGETEPVWTRIDAIVDGYAYQWEAWGEAPARMRISDGVREALAVKGPVVGFVEGHTVVGQYAPPMPPQLQPEEGRGFGFPVGLLVRAALFLAGPFGIFGVLFGML